MKNLKILRKRAGFSTQGQFSNHIGIPRPTLAKWESGKAKPRIGTLPSLAVALGCTVDELLSEAETSQMKGNTE